MIVCAISFHALLASARHPWEVSAATRTQKISHRPPISSITPSCALVKMQSIMCSRVRMQAPTVALSLQHLPAKDSSQSTTHTKCTQTRRRCEYLLQFLDVTYTMLSAHLVKWVTESNRPVNIVDDRELRELLCAGRPHLNIPSPDTLARKIHLAYERARERIGKLLRISVCPAKASLVPHTLLDLGSTRSSALCNGCMDITKPPCFRGMDCSSRARG